MHKINSLDDIPSTETIRRVLNRKRYHKLFLATLRSTVIAVTVAAAVVVLISWFALPAVRVTGTSMEPLLSNGNIIICNKFSDAERGDVIAMYYNKKVLLKRIIAVAGDEIDIDENGRVILNGALLDEPYITEFSKGECDIEFPFTVKESRYFVMGDNRDVSIDSRTSVFGCVSDENVLGVVWLRVYPFGLPHLIGNSDEKKD